MKLLPLLGLLALAAAPQQGKDPSEGLFAKMIEKLGKAKTLQVKVSVRGEGDAEKTTMKGLFLLGEGGRFRTEWSENHGKRNSVEFAVSDGKAVTCWSDRAKAVAPGDPPEWMNRHLAGVLARAGAARASGEAKLQAGAASNRKKSPPPDAPDLDAMFRFTSKTAGESAQLNGRNCPGIVLKTAEQTVLLHVDPKTFLPAQRTTTFNYGSGEAKLIETYEGWKVDEKIEDAKFALPDPEKK